MRRIISLLCVCCTLFLSVSEAYIKREIDLTKEEIIPFSFSSSKAKIEELIDIKKYKNVKVLDTYVDNGEIETDLIENFIEVNLDDGEFFSGNKIVTKNETLYLEEELTDKQRRTVLVTPDNEVAKIIDVGGDFSSGNVSNGDIELKVKTDAVGSIIESDTETEVKRVNVEIPSTNKNRTVYSEYITLPNTLVNAEVLSVADGTAKVYKSKNSFRILFDNGTPNLTETKKTDGYTYYWADRALDGSFKKEYPNSVYKTDKKDFYGEGEYIEGKKSLDELMYNVSFEPSWKDYAGVNINGVKYMYIFDDTKGIPDVKDRILLDEDNITLDGEWCNSEKIKIEFTDSEIKFIPEGKLYSMGDIVKNTYGWGETYPNRDDESKESFFNTLTGKLETYVKHFKFFYGPKEKNTFGGFFTYPYTAQVEYEYKKPITVYSGYVTYSYEEEEKQNGYMYNGWVKISYDTTKSVNDYPPTAPYNIHYNEKVVWNAGTDDYTPQDRLRYEIEVETGNTWQHLDETDFGETEYEYENGQDLKFRVRTVDELNQVSDWGYSNEDEIELIGSVTPNRIYSGDKIDIEALTKSLTDIVGVHASCEELGIDASLNKVSESKVNFNELAFELWCKYNTSKDSTIMVYNSILAKNKGDKIVSSYYTKGNYTKEYMLYTDLPEIFPFDVSGTVVVPNQNYVDNSIDIFKANNKWWWIRGRSVLSMKNKNTNSTEDFIYFMNDTASVSGSSTSLKLKPYIKVNTFEYTNNKPKTKKVYIDPSIAGDPISILWNTKDGLTNINIYFGTELVYTYEVPFSSIENNIEGFAKYNIGKTAYQANLTTDGFAIPSSGNYYEWTQMKKMANLLETTWLGYKFTEDSKGIAQDTLVAYNNLGIRNVNRMLFLDKDISISTLKKYLNLIKSTNISIDEDTNEGVFGSQVQERECNFTLLNVDTAKNVESGIYFITLTAYDDSGNEKVVRLPIEVLEKEEEIEDEVATHTTSLGRFFYDKSGNGYVEELSKPYKNPDGEGFISAGETLCLVLELKNAEFIEVNFNGNESIKTYDSLTKRFIEDEPKRRGEDIGNISENYEFPRTIYPTRVDSDGTSRFVFSYVVPYRTKQNLESWATLREKSGDAETIDKSKLLNRIFEPYELEIKINGEEDNKKVYSFDVFERWDTILNRNVSNLISNYNTKWRLKL
ncbi:MAG: hypothetical protein IJS47_01380 [Clostridia bacterium]|nr:hypothetical protein [Clostridia bacterium]